MQFPSQPTRRDLLLASGALAAAASSAAAAAPPAKVFRIGVVSARIGDKPQTFNGHTWHFAQYFHPEVNLDAIKRLLDPGSSEMFRKTTRNPKMNFDQLPFPDTRITHYYERDPKIAAVYTEAFPGVKVARTLEEMVNEVDAVWMGDASGRGEDHFDLVAPGLAKGLPTFCDKPIGGTVAETRKILDFAKKHNTPIMSSSLFRHEFGMEQAVRMRDSGDFGPIQFVLASMAGGYSPEGWIVYGQHPAWTVMTLLGPGVDAVSLYARESAAHGLVTYKDRMPGEIWYGRPDCKTYNHVTVYFTKQPYEFSAAIEGDFWYGHHYEMFRMANTFREMIRTRKEPVPHQEILEVTGIIQAGVKSLKEKGRLVSMSEVMG